MLTENAFSFVCVSKCSIKILHCQDVIPEWEHTAILMQDRKINVLYVQKEFPADTVLKKP